MRLNNYTDTPLTFEQINHNFRELERTATEFYRANVATIGDIVTIERHTNDYQHFISCRRVLATCSVDMSVGANIDIMFEGLAPAAGKALIKDITIIVNCTGTPTVEALQASYFNLTIHPLPDGASEIILAPKKFKIHGYEAVFKTEIKHFLIQAKIVVERDKAAMYYDMSPLYTSSLGAR